MVWCVCAHIHVRVLHLIDFGPRHDEESGRIVVVVVVALIRRRCLQQVGEGEGLYVCCLADGGGGVVSQWEREGTWGACT